MVAEQVKLSGFTVFLKGHVTHPKINVILNINAEMNAASYMDNCLTPMIKHV